MTDSSVLIIGAGPVGLTLAIEIGRLTYAINVQQYACAGLNFGYYYDASPIIAYDRAEPPPYTMADYTPSTVPGCRMPHLWLKDGRSLYDAMGPAFTLLRLDTKIDAAALEAAARERRLPLKIPDVERPHAAGLDAGSLVLSRPDSMWPGAAIACRTIRQP